MYGKNADGLYSVASYNLYSSTKTICEYDTYMSALLFVILENDRKRGFFWARFLHFTPWREEKGERGVQGKRKHNNTSCLVSVSPSHGRALTDTTVTTLRTTPRISTASMTTS